MTDISADERQALCIDHYEDAVESPGQCFFCGVPYPCETVRLLDALEAAEREREALHWAHSRLLHLADTATDGLVSREAIRAALRERER